MHLQRLLAAFLAVYVCVVGNATAAELWPEVPTPPKAKAEWVGDSMRINGVPTRVLQFQSKAPRAEVVEYYRSYWSGGYPTKPTVTPLGAATVVSQRHGPYFMTVKVEDAEARTSHGLISVARVAGIQVKRDPGDLPLLSGAQVLSVVESDDPGKHSRDVVLVTPQPATSVTKFYEASFTNAGWQQLQATEGIRSAGGVLSSFLVYAKEGNEMQLSIVSDPKDRGSQVVANLVTKDTVPAAN
jgi:hypothetical protein